MGKQQYKIIRHSTPMPTNEFMGNFEQIPKYMQENQHIRQGYRMGFDSPKKVVKTLFMVHNETVNIWTHLVGAVIVIFLIFEAIAYGMEESHILGKAIIEPVVMPYKQSARAKSIELCEQYNQGLAPGEEPLKCFQIQQRNGKGNEDSESNRFDSLVPTWPILIALLGGSICLSCSAVYHWVFQMNQKINKISLSLDLAGIGMNMMFAPVPFVYYAFYCDKQTAYTYIAINVVAGTASLVSNLFSWAQKHENRGLRISIIGVAAAFCSIGLIHVFINQFVFGNFGDSYTMKPTLNFFIPTTIFYSVGFMFFLAKCPERKRPGHYDICGHSHQIWHVFVVLGIIFTYLSSIASYEMRSLYSTCPLVTDYQ